MNSGIPVMIDRMVYQYRDRGGLLFCSAEKNCPSLTNAKT